MSERQMLAQKLQIDFGVSLQVLKTVENQAKEITREIPKLDGLDFMNVEKMSRKRIREEVIIHYRSQIHYRIIIIMEQKIFLVHGKNHQYFLYFSLNDQSIESQKSLTALHTHRLTSSAATLVSIA
ncbi:uncharacterized protein LOC107981348 [Nasonia vitripennis]|uniref:Uncharacterized protein n=1 Tax=Nasonia vitripennis TaxID=7425 RepID=A0A7M7Q2F5_NASVI|nr:uncharacterized protein LOC107981348 [Nasonia vitripennis]